ncbi:hypothetical protein HNQ95_004873 [Aminobacter ciceronei]|uniref:Uncharacterized protein n=1 Tax=Aminobacter ciceronei TaxID=150723 RepID=A0ABR6CCU2_9HYPH|nr:hypothetical protein [Aminobacter ciceronei]MBA8909076.1 hypothetical protein [Aminobacter ciceronei]MBA9022848.1 hypothetical protein [Aminobacter ciceronei]
MQRTSGDQHRHRDAVRADQRRQREDDRAGGEHAAVAETVACPAGQQQQAAEGQGIGVEDPLQVALGGVERLRQRGAGNHEDDGIDDHQELGAADDEEHQRRGLCRRAGFG